MILVFLLAALMASTYTFGKAALMYTSPFFLVGFRLVVAGFIFLIYYTYKRPHVPPLNKKNYLLLGQIIFFSFYAGFVLEFWALDHLTSVKTAFLYCLSPIVSAFLSYLVFGEKMTVKKIFGLLIALGGFMPTLIATAPTEGATLFFISWPEIILLMAVFSFAYGLVVTRKVFKHHPLPVSFINSVGMLTGGAMALLTSYMFEVPYASDKADWILSWLPITNITAFLSFVLPLILIGNVICYLLYTYLLKHYTATLVTFVELTTPLFAALYGFIFLHEHISWTFFLSVGLLLFGMYLYYQEEARLGYI